MNRYLSAIEILKDEPLAAAAIEASLAAGLPNWCIIGGLVRDLVWGRALNRAVAPRDIDLIYFDKNNASREADLEIESEIEGRSGLPFRVKNQARMHLRNSDLHYSGIADAMTKFPTTVSAVGITSNSSRQPIMFSIFGYDSLFCPVFQITPHFLENQRQDDFFQYLDRNRLRERWPEVPISIEGPPGPGFMTSR